MATKKPAPPAEPTLAVVDASEVEPWPDLNTRTFFDEAEQAQLDASVTTQGIRQPVALHDRGEGESPRYWLVAGERRLRSARKVGVPLPAAIGTYSFAEALEVNLIENIGRANLRPLEEARGFQRWLDATKKPQKVLAERLGLDQSTVSNRVRLLELPDSIQQLVDEGRIAASNARDLLVPWAKEKPDVSRRFFMILGQHIGVQQDANEPLSKAWLQSTVETIGRFVKPEKAAKKAAAKPAAKPTEAPAAKPAAAATPAPEEPTPGPAEQETAPPAVAPAPEPAPVEVDAPPPPAAAAEEEAEVPPAAAAEDVLQVAGIVGALAPLFADRAVTIALSTPAKGTVTVVVGQRFAEGESPTPPFVATLAIADAEEHLAARLPEWVARTQETLAARAAA